MADKVCGPICVEKLGASWIDQGTLALTNATPFHPELSGDNTRPTAGGHQAKSAKKKAPSCNVSTKLKIDWDVALLERKPVGLTGAGRVRVHFIACTTPVASQLKKTSTFNRVCPRPLPKRKRVGKITTYKQQHGHGGKQAPEPVIRHSARNNEWVIEQLQVYAVIDVAEPVEGAYPVFGKNVTTDKSYGVRGKRNKPPSKKAEDKGYYVDVANNLKLYTGAHNKPVTNMYWWVKGSTMRHEKKHFELYKTWFDSAVKIFLKRTAAKIQSELRSGALKATRENLEKTAGILLWRMIDASKGHKKAGGEVQVSAITAREFHALAKEILAKGKQLEKPSSKPKTPATGVK